MDNAIQKPGVNILANFEVILAEIDAALAAVDSYDDSMILDQQIDALGDLLHNINAGLDMINEVNSRRIDSIKLAGGYLIPMGRNEGRPKAGNPAHLLEYKDARDRYGLSRREAGRRQKASRIPDHVTDTYRDSCLEKGVEMTEGGHLGAGKAWEASLRDEEIKDSLVTVPSVVQSSAIDWLNGVDEPCDLLMTDPPYSTDVDDIVEFANWLPLALSKVKPTGRAYVFVGAYPQELHAYLSVAMPTQVLVWEYRNMLGPLPTHNYKQNWQAILYYCMPDAPRMRGDTLTERFSVMEFNSVEHQYGKKHHTWQKPLTMSQMLIVQASKPGDLVYDPYTGTGTFLLAAASIGRDAYGCELDSDMIAIARERGCDGELANRSK